MATEQGNDMAAPPMTMENPPPYSPLKEQPTQQHVQQFMQQNPQGFVQPQQYQPAPMGGFSDISHGYGYNQPPTSQMSTQSTVIVNQPQAAPIVIVNQAPYSYIIPAIVVCLFCCWPLGIGAIVAAAISESQSGEMRYEEARKTANIAKILTLTSLICGIAAYVCIIIVVSV